jgi:hypothetical protein
MLVHRVQFNRPIVRLLLKIKRPIDRDMQKRLQDAYIQKLEYGNEPKDFGDYSKLVSKQGFEQLSYYKTKEPLYIETEAELKNPLPPLPLHFSFGAFHLKPCVIKSMHADIIRHNRYNRITACNLEVVLQEIVGTDPWATPASVAGRKRIADVRMDIPTDWSKVEGLTYEEHFFYEDEDGNMVPISDQEYWQDIAPTFAPPGDTAPGGG